MLQTLIWRTGRIAPPQIARRPGGGTGAPCCRRGSACSSACSPSCAAGCWPPPSTPSIGPSCASPRPTACSRSFDQGRSPMPGSGCARRGGRSRTGRTRCLRASRPLRAPTSRVPCATTKCSCWRPSRNRLQDDIGVVHQFLIRLAVCVRMGSCTDVAAAQLGPALWTFATSTDTTSRSSIPVDLDQVIETIAPRPAGRRISPDPVGKGPAQGKSAYITMMAWADAFGANGGRFRPEW